MFLVPDLVVFFIKRSHESLLGNSRFCFFFVFFLLNTSTLKFGRKEN